MRWHSYQSPLRMRKDESAVVGRRPPGAPNHSITITSKSKRQRKQVEAEAEEEL